MAKKSTTQAVESKITDREWDVSDNISDATCKLDLLQTLASLMINMMEDIGELDTAEKACIFAYNRDTYLDLLHISIDEIVEAQKALNEAETIIFGRREEVA